jgi:hypothetical protein
MTLHRESSNREGRGGKHLTLTGKSERKEGKGFTKGKARHPGQVIPMDEGEFKDF